MIFQVAEKQAAIRATKKLENQLMEDEKNSESKNLEKAEKEFFESVRKLKIEREEKYLKTLY